MNTDHDFMFLKSRQASLYLLTYVQILYLHTNSQLLDCEKLHFDSTCPLTAPCWSGCDIDLPQIKEKPPLYL